MPAPPKSRQKIRKHAKRILRNTFPPTPSISQNFARVPHFCTLPPLPPKHCGEVQSVLPHFCFSRSSVLRTEALQRAGNASDYDFEKMFELGTIETPKRNQSVSNELRCGRRKATPTLFVFVLRGNAGNSARKRALFFQKGGDSKSRAIQNNLSERTKRIFVVEIFLIY